jgi:hypothetical protein
MKQFINLNEQELHDLMLELAKGLKETCTIQNVEAPFFALVVFNDPRIGQYISNCDRPSMIQALRETADRIERKQDVHRDYSNVSEL